MTPFRARLGDHALLDQVPAIAMPGRSIGYPELVHLVDACAARLVRDGCAPGDTVGFSVPDETGHLVVSLALAALGLRQVILATHAPPGMRIDLARRLAVRRVVVSDPAHAVPGIAVIVLGSAESSDSPSVRPAVPLDGGQDGPRFLFTSSGTTGRAKIYDLDLAAVDWRATTVHRSERGNARQRLYVSHAIEHRAGHVRRLYAAWLGVTSILQAPRTRMSTGALCRAMNPTHLELTVLEAMGLVQDDAIPLPSGTIVHGSGTRIPSALRGRFRARHGLPLHVHYGASEFGRIASTLDGPGASPDIDDDSVGWTVPGVEVEIIGADGHRLPAGEAGEIRVRGATMGGGFLDDPEATARHFRGGWYHPGDLGRLDRDGRLWLAGRTDEMMSLSGINIHPAEIEVVLETHPAVRAALAYARPSGTFGDIPVADVELLHRGSVTEAELLAMVRDALGARAPRRIRIVDALPRNAAGKVVRKRPANRARGR